MKTILGAVSAVSVAIGGCQDGCGTSATGTNQPGQSTVEVSQAAPRHCASTGKGDHAGSASERAGDAFRALAIGRVARRHPLMTDSTVSPSRARALSPHLLQQW